MVTYSNAENTCSALKKLDFLVVADMFMTPTADLADIVLPVAGYLEHDSIVSTPAYPIAQVQQKVAQVGECRSDYEILNGLAGAMGLGAYFWETEEACLDALLAPAGLSFSEFRKIGLISGTKLYRNYLTEGFETPSGKVELYSHRLEEWGFDPLPTYHKQREDSEAFEEYPLILTSWKREPFRHSGGKQIKSLLKIHPEPVTNIHPQTAEKLGIREGDMVYIETGQGKIMQKAVLSDFLDPRVVGVDYGWWFPQEGATRACGWSRSNLNILTDDKPPFNPELGSVNLRGIRCKVYSCGDEA